MFLDGDIDSGAPQSVAAALQSLKGQAVLIVMNSPGGSLIAGMQLGRVIRKAGAMTTLGTWTKQTPGECYSACALAFLGGAFRFDEPGSSYGVDRVSSAAGPGTNNLESGQGVFAAITNYVREMDVDPGLLNLIASTGAGEIRQLSPQERIDLGVVNGGRKKPQWSIEAVPAGIYLRGVQETVYGVGRALILCKGKSASMLSVFEAGAEKVASIADKSNGWVHSLLFSDEMVHVKPMTVEAKGDSVNVMLPLDQLSLLKLAGAKSIGHAMQMSYESTWFIGYRVDVDKASAENVKNYAMNCISGLQ
jgi:hypothetical protein